MEYNSIVPCTYVQILFEGIRDSFEHDFDWFASLLHHEIKQIRVQSFLFNLLITIRPSDWWVGEVASKHSLFLFRPVYGLNAIMYKTSSKE